MKFAGIGAAAAVSALRRVKALLCSRSGTLSLWCLALVGACAMNVVLMAQPGTLFSLAQAAETALAQATDLASPPDRAADTPSDLPANPNPDGGAGQPSDLNGGAATYKLTTARDGDGQGLLNILPDGSIFSPGTQVTLSTTPAGNSVFTGWAGACTGASATCQITMTADKTVTATFSLKANKLAVTADGSGTVSGVTQAGGSSTLTCQDSCSWSYPFGTVTRVTLTAAPKPGYLFRGWSGVCTGTAPTCAISVDANMAVTAVFAPILRVGAIFSTAQPSSLSFLRLYNTGATAGTAAITLYNPTTGVAIGTWTTPAVAPGTAPQYSIGNIEADLGIGAASAKPDYYTMSVETIMSGYFQHVLWRGGDETFTNLSTCGSGITIDGARLNNVHASTFDQTYPSSIVVNNTGQTETSIVLGVYDAATNTRLGAMNLLSIPARGRVVLTSGQVETGAGIEASASIPHYVIQAESKPAFTGFLEHLVNNLHTGVITDMTTACSLGGAPITTTASTLTSSLIFSTAQPSSQSFLRLYNTGTAAGTATVSLYDAGTGRSLGQWTSPSIPGGAEQQFFIGEMESAVPADVTKPDYYSITVAANFSGYFQHVLWRAGTGTLTNLSTCRTGVTADPMALGGVHSSLLSSDYPSQVVINNTGSTALKGPLLGIYDARDGTKLGVYTADDIPPNGQVVVSSATFEAQNHLVPSDGMYHYVIKAETPFSGFLQHLVNNQKAHVTTDMTTSCGLQATVPVAP